MSVVADVPFYSDWKFWSFLVSFIAIALSQFPPIRLWLKRAKLEIDPYSQLPIMHDVGNPQVQLHMILSNTGGRRIRVRGMLMEFKRDGALVCALPAMNYLEEPNDQAAVLFVSFKLEPGEDWVHIVNFFVSRARQEEKTFRQLQSNLRNDIQAKQVALVNERDIVSADEEYVKPLVDIFSNKFVWLPGEYEVAIRVETEPNNGDGGS